MMEAPVMVEIVMVSDLTNAPAPEVRKKPKEPANEKVEAPKPEPKPEPPRHQAKAEPTPPPPPAPEPEPEVAVVPPTPEPNPKAKVKPKPQPKPKPKAPEKVKSSKVLTKVRPRKKPKPPKPVDAFASVLKTVAQLTDQPRPTEKPKDEEKKKKKKTPEETFEQQIAKVLVSKKRTFDASSPVSISEIDLVRQQIGKCWNVPAGAKNAENINIEIAINMNPDGTVLKATVNNKGLDADPFLRTMAESAIRAVMRCQPFQLPRNKYNRWKTMTLIFNPKEMFGG
ncbi:MAG TPA: energy transducer TonB [Rhodospirillales bacterium]|nr:energy transducer TonB [Rhodospirillales bacterium]